MTSTTPITALIADDEEAPRAQLRAALQSAWPELGIVAECANGVDAWDAWLEHEPQVCFLDIRMPGMTGIEVARRIGGRTPVVFVTAYGDHALAAFDAGAVDYVMKPVDPERLARALQRVRERVEKPALNPAGLQALLEQLAGGARRPPALDTIQAGVGKEVRQIRVADVVYFEADARYTRVVHVSDGSDGEALIRTPLKELLAQLDERAFVQVHRSVIVARRHVAAAVRIDEGHMHLTLRGRKETLPVSRPFQGLFKSQ
jgi:DNA-binding LytR/AlgR family response regulator